MLKILHVTAHMGGGVGKILSGIAVNDHLEFEHTILCLEKTNNPHFYDLCVKNGITVIQFENATLSQLFSSHDIVQIEWWHHPLVTKFMLEMLRDFPSRLVVWSHISGCSYPCIPASFLSVPMKFLFTSAYSYENKTWTEHEKQWARENTAVVSSCATNFPPFSTVKKNSDVFTIGYVGFLGYEKLHPAFADICGQCAHIENVQIKICGETNYGIQLLEDIAQNPAAARATEFQGYVKEPESFFSAMDVFLYPLHPEHTGTTENALLEAMASGVVPIILNQCSEQYIVRHMETGIVVQRPDQCVQAVGWLKEHPEERVKMGQAAAEHVRKSFSLNSSIHALHGVYCDMMKQPKTCYQFEKVFGETPFEWFSNFYIGDLSHLQGVAAGESKSSAAQYFKYYPQDNRLRKVCEENYASSYSTKL